MAASTESSSESRVLSKHAKQVPVQQRFARRGPVTPGRHAARHRAPAGPLVPAAVRRGVTLGGLAAAVTGVAVTGGVLGSTPVSAVADQARADLGGTAPQGVTAADLAQRREAEVSRSDRRSTKDAAKVAVLGTGMGAAVAGKEDLSDADPRTIGRALLAEYGFADSQWSCLDALFVSESNWRIDADNPSSSAYGIPQALTGTHAMPPGYFTSAEVQIRWGLDYISSRYGSPCSAWSFKQGHNWY